MKTIVIIPTYNERENIRELIPAIEKEGLGLDLLVVDSASPDGTADAVRNLQRQIPRLHLVTQAAKLGLGKAYLEGMRWAIHHGYEIILTMDADFSHHPRYLKGFLDQIQKRDLVIGSRYVPGGGQKSWPFHRRLLSRLANLYARLLMGVPVSDLTSGFHCFRAPLLQRIMNCPVYSEGYAFLMELKYLAVLLGARVGELPIIFSDRTQGDSKISKKVIAESIFYVLGCCFQRSKLRKVIHKEALRHV